MVRLQLQLTSLIRQNLLMSWPLKDRVPSPLSTRSAQSSHPAATRQSMAPTSALPSPSLWTPHPSETSLPRGDSAISFWEVPSTALASSGLTSCRDLSPSYRSACSFTTEYLTCSSWLLPHSWSTFRTGDWPAFGTTDSDGTSPRINFANTTTPAYSKRTPSGVHSSPAEIDTFRFLVVFLFI